MKASQDFPPFHKNHLPRFLAPPRQAAKARRVSLFLEAKGYLTFGGGKFAFRYYFCAAWLCAGAAGLEKKQFPPARAAARLKPKHEHNPSKKTMKEYKAGEFYSFRVFDFSSSSHKLFLKDDDDRIFSVYAYDFQTEWDAASSQTPEQTISCYVKEVASTGAPTLQQNREALLLALYPEARTGECKECPFVVDKIKTTGSGELLYVVRDAYGITHLFKPSPSKPALQPGDEVRLCVTGFEPKDGNRSCIHLSDFTDGVAPRAATSGGDTPVGEFGEEDDTHEFKSTIIYPAGAVGADIDMQMMIIVKTIAGFMNAAGGILYIGVNDNGEAIGIENEYKLLNSSAKDAHHYQENKDGYENKLRSAISAFLGPVAQDYVSIKFSVHKGHTICEVQVESAKCVIWYIERDAYKRMGNRTTHLRSSAIEKLVLDKMKLSRPVASQVAPTLVSTQDEVSLEEPTDDAATETEPQATKTAGPAKIMPIGEKKTGEGSFYMNLFKNGDWSWSKDVPTDDDLEFCIPINSPTDQNDLIMVYADGCVNRVNSHGLHLNKKENTRYKNGRRTDGVKLLKAFHATEDDLLSCESTQDGHPFVKVHRVGDVGRHSTMNTNGNRLINVASLARVEMKEICFVAAEHFNRISALIKTENQRTNTLGFQMDLPKIEAKLGGTVGTLKNLCDVPGQMAFPVL